LIPQYYDPVIIDYDGIPPEDCTHWFLSDEAICRLGYEEVDFNADYSTGDEDPHEA